MIAKEARVTSKGQVTIPKEIRERLELDAGTEVEFVLDDEGQITVHRKRSTMAELQALRDRLADHDVDLDEMRAASKRAWADQAGFES
ncbi:looped-hinge helix DNA binding domain, AbrB family [Halovivax ruber XH-70]|uniref:Looped-hinge helix DNA binding domain, AbrB family n=1 Tax=Halovivax ruber (strain DSM 18193 / JCM 13892 / XH-70) TaxID=797302 RepID=L0IFI1_HALRX|nr:AbrB/MazE/SpoVT family DNA-binding domain-containing protein [Halovivax ruber]AGB17603.1 looped-hinge helix DNA binding domain, AbrB family [Halovivax ruber XH-70]